MTEHEFKEIGNVIKTELTHIEKDLENQYLSGHAIVKRTNEPQPWRLIKYSEDGRILTDAELKAFQ